MLSVALKKGEPLMAIQNQIRRSIDKKYPLRDFPENSGVLIIDDDADFLELLEDHISQISGTEISVAYSCDQAVDLLTRRPFQLVVCDWALAARTGPDVFRLADPLIFNRCEKPARKTPVIFMSGSEKVALTQSLRAFKNFEPVTFMLKNLGAPMIRVMAENILQRFSHCEPESEPLKVYHS